MKGYKATYNGKCLDLQYELNKEYILEGKLKACSNGYHFCQNFDDVFGYYNFTNKLKIYEIDTLDGDVITEYDKSVTNKIKLVREIPFEEWKDLSVIGNKYSKEFLDDNKFKLIYENPRNFWTERTYNENGNILLYEDSTDYWIEKTYNENGKLLTYRDSSDYWYKRTYDENDNELTYKDSTDYWWKRTFDEKGNVLTYKDSNDYWCKYTYDENGKLLTCKTLND